MTIRHHSVLGICIHFLLLTSCAKTAPVETIEPIPVQNVSDTFKGEQGNIIRMFGFPDKATQSSLGVTTWVYCSGEPNQVIIQFDKSGEVLNALPRLSCSCFIKTK